MARLTDDERIDQGPSDGAGPTGQRTGLESEVKRPALLALDAQVAAERFGLARKADVALMISLVVHAPQDALPGVEIERGVEWRFCSSFHGLLFTRVPR